MLMSRHIIGWILVVVLAATTAAFPSARPRPRRPLPRLLDVGTPRHWQHHQPRTSAIVSLLWMTKPKRAIYLTHERDYFRQETRLDSMDSYVLVSTLTASMSFGCLCSFTPSTSLILARAWQRLAYHVLCQAITTLSGLVTIYGLYATIVFSLTLLYSKSALGAERDREYNIFLRKSIRARVHGARCFAWSMALFAAEALLVLLERFLRIHAAAATTGSATRLSWTILPIMGSALFTLFRLAKDWRLLHQSTEVIYKD